MAGRRVSVILFVTFRAFEVVGCRAAVMCVPRVVATAPIFLLKSAALVEHQFLLFVLLWNDRFC